MKIFLVKLEGLVSLKMFRFDDFFQNRKSISIIIPEFFSLSSSSFETSEVFEVVARSSAGSNKLCFSEENAEEMREKIEVQQNFKNLYNAE